GLELPINAIVIVSIAVLVLVVVSSFFLSGSGKQFSEIEARTAFNRECGKLSCSAAEATSLAQRHPELYEKCQALYGSGVSAPQCMNACGCRIDYSSTGEIAQEIDADMAGIAEDVKAA
ncbi:MAG: hypothetical protein HY368_02925, partial [Candidatus Aenigmarchaeota archaeon]|nr:hypothetical protein [Candidatus Aenigmarchaeota archaeon]